MTTIKLLIFSDTHGKVGAMLDYVEREMPDEVFHLGDCLRDAEALAFAFPELPVTRVPGNCDGWTGKPDQLVVEREGIRLLLAHGHQWRVKSGPAQALAAARGAEADVLLYGHTHQALCQQVDRLLVMNPGTAGGIGAPASCGVLVVGDGAVSGQIVPIH